MLIPNIKTMRRNGWASMNKTVRIIQLWLYLKQNPGTGNSFQIEYILFPVNWELVSLCAKPYPISLRRNLKFINKSYLNMSYLKLF